MEVSNGVSCKSSLLSPAPSCPLRGIIGEDFQVFGDFHIFFLIFLKDMTKFRPILRVSCAAFKGFLTGTLGFVLRVLL
jgi:hypothetical protein